MRSELEKIREIEDYLLGKLNDVDRQKFNLAVKSNAALSREVEFQKNLMNRVITFSTRQAVIEAGERFKAKNKRFFWRYIFRFLVALVLLGFLLYINIARKKVPLGEIGETYKGQNYSFKNDSTESTTSNDTLNSKQEDNLVNNTSKLLSKKAINEKPKIIKKLRALKIDMIRVEGGAFDISDDFSIEMKPYELSKYEITQAQWRTVMGTNPSHFQGCDQCPVEQVSWNDIQVFVQTLNKRDNSNYRLPKHTEWSFAARGGVKRSGFMYYKNKKAIREMAWCAENSDSKTHPVGQKIPNELGIYDLNGNVWEWVADVWPDDYEASIRSTHQRAKDKSDKILIGGSYAVSSKDFYLVWYLPEFTEPSDTSPNLGFRLVRSIE